MQPVQFFDTVEISENTLWGAYIPQKAFYISPVPVSAASCLYCTNRAGIVQTAPKNFHVARHGSYPYTQIHCVLSGKGTLRLAGKTYDLKPGQLFFIPPNEPHEYWADPENPMGVVWTEFCGGDNERLAGIIFKKHGPIYGEVVCKSVADLLTGYLSRSAKPTDIQSSVVNYEILMLLYENVQKVSSKTDELLHQIYAYVDEHLEEHLRLTDVARTFGYNPSYFSTFFSQNAGMTFSKYLTHRRITKACYLLVMTDKSLDEIAQQLCFCDTSHFVQRFREVEQVSPATYRKNNMGSLLVPPFEENLEKGNARPWISDFWPTVDF